MGSIPTNYSSFPARYRLDLARQGLGGGIARGGERRGEYRLLVHRGPTSPGLRYTIALGRRIMHLKRSIKHPIREFVDMDHRWRGPDAGLIWCWELGRQRADKEPELAERVREGALVPLGWKGGVANGTKSKKRRDLFFIWQSGKVLLAKISTLTPKVILVWFV